MLGFMGKTGCGRGAHSSAMHIDNKREAVERADSVDTGGTDFTLAIFREPELEVSASSFDAAGSELEFGCPFGLGDTVHG